MELVQKGSEANVGGFKQLMVAMKWTTAADFDLAAAYENKKANRNGLFWWIRRSQYIPVYAAKW